MCLRFNKRVEHAPCKGAFPRFKQVYLSGFLVTALVIDLTFFIFFQIVYLDCR